MGAKAPQYPPAGSVKPSPPPPPPMRSPLRLFPGDISVVFDVHTCDCGAVTEDGHRHCYRESCSPVPKDRNQ